jgi:hypothetical protein
MREIAQAEAMSFEQQLIFTLKTMYAQQFAKHFADMPMNIVGNVISAALAGVDQDGFNRGMARLLSGQSSLCQRCKSLNLGVFLAHGHRQKLGTTFVSGQETQNTKSQYWRNNAGMKSITLC